MIGGQAGEFIDREVERLYEVMKKPPARYRPTAVTSVMLFLETYLRLAGRK
jgi:hypothetical protein